MEKEQPQTLARNAFIGLKTIEPLKEALARLAQKDDRSVSKYIERVLLDNAEVKAEMERAA